MAINNLLLTPPVVFILVLGAALALAAFLSKQSFKPKIKSEDCGKSYACGENVATNLMQPDYTQFFPFAFFFTILHVVTLIIATVPVDTMRSLSMAVLYLLGAVVAMFILFRKW